MEKGLWTQGVPEFPLATEMGVLHGKGLAFNCSLNSLYKVPNFGV